MLSLSRDQGGRGAFNYCRLDVVVFESQANAAVECELLAPDAKGRTRLTARRDLAADETRRLIAAVEGARLFDGDHVGTDTRAVDGRFETLKVVKRARAVVLVTSGNPTFSEEGLTCVV